MVSAASWTESRSSLPPLSDLDARDDRVVLLGANPLRASSAARLEEHSGLLGAPRAAGPGQMASNASNPLQAAAMMSAAGAPSIAVAYHPQHQMSQRTQMLGARVAQVKAQRLTCFELLSSKGLGTLFSVPFLGLTGLISIPAATSCAIFRFGKLDCVISEPGLTWVAPFYERVQMVRVRACIQARAHVRVRAGVIRARGAPSASLTPPAPLLAAAVHGHADAQDE